MRAVPSKEAVMVSQSLSVAQQELLTILKTAYTFPIRRFEHLVELIYRQPVAERSELVRSMLRWSGVVLYQIGLENYEPSMFDVSQREGAFQLFTDLVAAHCVAPARTLELGPDIQTATNTVQEQLDLLAGYGLAVQSLWLARLLATNPGIPYVHDLRPQTGPLPDGSAIMTTLWSWPDLMAEVDSLMRTDDANLAETVDWINRLPLRTSDPLVIHAFTRYIIARAIEAAVDGAASIASVPDDGAFAMRPVDPKDAN